MQTLQDGNLLSNISFWINAAVVAVTSFAVFVIKQLKFSDRQQWKKIDEISSRLDRLQGAHDSIVGSKNRHG